MSKKSSKKSGLAKYTTEQIGEEIMRRAELVKSGVCPHCGVVIAMAVESMNTEKKEKKSKKSKKGKGKKDKVSTAVQAAEKKQAVLAAS